MVPVHFKTEIQYEPALVSVMVQYLAQTGRCARFVSVGLYFDISSPRLSILDKSCPEHKSHTVRCAFVRAPHRHTHTHMQHTRNTYTQAYKYTHTYIMIYMHTFTHTRNIHPHPHTYKHTHTHTRNTSC